ncbi:hypothetical protein WN944_025896 [Citrus x changshan-huyou]|uniref:Uncharacterized protein n=1 Tax=Citrus x changshan-huyou TaxID=2935761 RepID=A0AAP0QE25_9ROSI
MAQLGLHTEVSASLGEMFFEVELLRDVSVPAKSLDRNGLQVPQRYIVTRLLKGLISEKACKDHCYLLSVTNLKSVGKERGTVNESGVVFLPYALLSPRRMPTYRYVSKEGPFFSNEQQAKIGNGLVVQFDEGRNLRRKYLVFGRVEGESLGPVSLSGRTGNAQQPLRQSISKLEHGEKHKEDEAQAKDTSSPTEGANIAHVPVTNATVIANMEARMKQRATLTRNVIC